MSFHGLYIPFFRVESPVQEQVTGNSFQRLRPPVWESVRLVQKDFAHLQATNALLARLVALDMRQPGFRNLLHDWHDDAGQLVDIVNMVREAATIGVAPNTVVIAPF